jgi:hypothetical protein
MTYVAPEFPTNVSALREAVKKVRRHAESIVHREKDAGGGR